MIWKPKPWKAGQVFMLSHMRGHIGNMERIVEICERHGIAMVEDCAHTMGAQWNGKMSGNFGHVAAFSTQTYKHMNSGEGGLLTTNDPEVAARLTMLSGSYMIYGKHGAGPDLATYADIRLDTPNCSGRMDNIRAAILRAQLQDLDAQIARWNARYQRIEAGLANAVGIDIIQRPQQEFYVGSSIHLHASAIDQIVSQHSLMLAFSAVLKSNGSAQRILWPLPVVMIAGATLANSRNCRSH